MRLVFGRGNKQPEGRSPVDLPSGVPLIHHAAASSLRRESNETLREILTTPFHFRFLITEYTSSILHWKLHLYRLKTNKKHDIFSMFETHFNHEKSFDSWQNSALRDTRWR